MIANIVSIHVKEMSRNKDMPLILRNMSNILTTSKSALHLVALTLFFQFLIEAVHIYR